MVGLTDPQIHDIPLHDIEIGDANVRRTDKDRDLEELAASIRKHGLLQPVVLRGAYGKPRYELIVGQRRYLAHKKLGMRTIRAVFCGELDNAQAAIRSLAENMHRAELNHADAAAAVTKLYKHFDKDERKVATETGMSLKRVRQYIDIEERASAKMKRKLKAGKVTPVDVQRVLRAAAGNIDKADDLLDKMQEYRLTTHQKRRLVEYGEGDPRASVETIIQEARRPRIETTVLVKLSEPARKGLDHASKALAMTPEEVASKALEDWLSAQGFMPG